MRYWKLFWVCALVMAKNVSAQSKVDTAALVKEFIRVMSFTNQANLYYQTTTSMSAVPVSDPKDTATTIGVFYRNKEKMFSGTSMNELYVDDSLMVQIDKENKSIWISKSTNVNPEKMNGLPPITQKMMELVRKSYSISRVQAPDGLMKLSFGTRKQPYSTSTTQSLIELEYWEKTLLPKSLLIEISLKQPLTEEIVTSLKEEGFNVTKLIQQIDGVDYMVSTQQVKVVFTKIVHSAVKLDEVPSYKKKLTWDEPSHQFVGVGEYSDYEITKTF